ncbi:unnamed protein product [Umbelopsis ramanniana]
MSFQPTSQTAPININSSHHTRRHSSSIGSLSRLPVMSSSWNSIKGLSVQEENSHPAGSFGSMNINDLTERALSPPGPGNIFATSKKSPAPLVNAGPLPVNKALTAVSASQKRPASPMRSAILEGQFLD